MKNESWKVYWNDYAVDTYIYGSEIFFHSKEDVEFKNNMMSPGTVIKKWHSKTNYQSNRIEPSLPMIDGEGKYHIKLNVSDESKDKLMLRLVFYDRYDYEVGDFVVRNIEDDFKCPIQTFSYDVQLINSGANHFHFRNIIITELIDE